MILALVFVFLSAVSALAGPTNPRRQEMLESLKRHQELQKARKVKSVNALGASEPAVSISLSDNLTSGETVTLTATVTGVDDTSNLKYEWALSDEDRDSDGYTYYGDKTEEPQLQYTFYSAGHYRCWVDVYQNGYKNDNIIQKEEQKEQIRGSMVKMCVDEMDEGDNNDKK